MANGIASHRQLVYRACVFLSAVAAAFAFGYLFTHIPRPRPELAAGDMLAHLAPRPARPDVVLVACDDNSVEKYGPVKTWPRTLLALGLRRIEQGKPKAVVFDLALDKRSHRGDSTLWRTMADAGNVVLGMAYDAARPPRYTPDDIRALVFLERFALADNLKLTPQAQKFPYALFEPPVSDFAGSARGIGVFLRETDPDGVLRSARLIFASTVQYPQPDRPLPGKFPQSRLADGAPVALPSLALVSAQRALDLDKNFVGAATGDTVRLIGNLDPPVNAPVDDQGRMLIRYAAPGAYTTYSFRDVALGKVKPEQFRDKIVLLGATAANDEATNPQATPLTARLPRVEVTANALATLLDRSYVGRFEHRILGILLLVGVVTGGCLMLTGGPRALLLGLALAAAYLGIAYGFFVSGHVLLPLIGGLLTILTPTLIALALSLGPFRPAPVLVSPTYVPPPPGAVH